MRALILAIYVALMLPAVAWGKPRVALVEFEGDANGEVNDMVAEALDDDYSVSGPSQVRRAMDKLGLEGDLSAEKQLKKVANELEAEAIVRGDLSKSDGKKVLHLKLFVGGKKVRGFKVEFVSTKSKKVREALKDKLISKLGTEESKPAEDEPKKDKDDEATADDEDKPKADADDEDPDGAKKKKRVARAGDEDSEEIGAEFEVKPARQSPHTANRAAIRVDFGPSASLRKLTFTSRNFEDAPNPYENAVVPGARVAGDLFPLAFGNPDGIAAGLGVGGDFDQTIGLKLRSSAQPGSTFPVKQSHWSVGGRFRIAFGKKPTSPTVTLTGGIFRRRFTVDRSGLMPGNIIDLPDVFYQGYNPGLQMRFPFVASVALVLGGDAYLVTNAGPIQKTNSYGQARVTGGEGFAGFDIVLGRFAIRAVAEASQVGFAFTGNGDQANNRDGDPTTKDVGGAADRVIGGALTFGVLY
jgi:hypothetical protein